MTVKELFNFIKGVRPGFAFTDDQLTVWLNEIEGHVQTDIWLLEPAVDETQTGLVEYDSTIDTETGEMVDANHELLVPFPWNKLYRYFLLMSIDLANGEYQRYANSYELFNEAYEEYAGWYAQHVSPANGDAITRGYYISAYQFAARGGYAGTEKEFYEELAHVGEAVESGERAEAAADAAEESADAAGEYAVLAGQQAARATNEAAKAKESADAAMAHYGAPLVALTAAEMEDQDRVYVYVGNETGYTNGNWYYFDGGSWVSGGVYNSVAVNTDTTLTYAGMAADAKETGKGINARASAIVRTSGSSFVEVVDIEDAAEGRTLNALEVDITPVQSGTGDPSPENERPIIGYNSAVVTRTGEGDNNAESIEVDFPEEAGTVYKGVLDVVNGTLTITHALLNLAGSTWVKSGNLFYRNVTWMKRGTNAEGHTDAICSRYKRASGSATASTDGTFCAGSSYVSVTTIAIHDNRYSTASDFAAHVEGHMLLPLATPITLEVVPDNITTVLGENHISADCGTVRLSYVVDTKLYINSVWKESYLLSEFTGDTAEDKLHTALDTIDSGVINCGDITITHPYYALEKDYRKITINGAKIVFSNDYNYGFWFDQSGSTGQTVPRITNSYINAKRTPLYSGASNCVGPYFSGCYMCYSPIYIMGNDKHYVQSPYIIACNLNPVETLIKTYEIWDLKIDDCRIESAGGVLIDITDPGVVLYHGIQHGVISDSVIEGRTNTIVRLTNSSSYGFSINGCYFEAIGLASENEIGLFKQTGSDKFVGITVENCLFLKADSGTYGKYAISTEANNGYSYIRNNVSNYGNGHYLANKPIDHRTYISDQNKNSNADNTEWIDGSPTPISVSTQSGMTNTDALYLYEGAEPGMNSGHWYYYKENEWRDGGKYYLYPVDTTLTVAGEPADAKTTGDLIQSLITRIELLENAT